MYGMVDEIQETERENQRLRQQVGILKAACVKSMEACCINLSHASHKNEQVLLDAYKQCQAAVVMLSAFDPIAMGA